MAAVLTAPNRAAWTKPVSLTVTSSAYGAWTIGIIAVAGTVLLVMVAWRIGQRWRARTARLAAEASGAGNPPIGRASEVGSTRPRPATTAPLENGAAPAAGTTKTTARDTRG